MSPVRRATEGEDAVDTDRGKKGTLPDGTGVDATRGILAHLPETCIVFLTVHAAEDLLLAAIRDGARGYLLKDVSITELLAYLRGLETSDLAVSPVLSARVLKQAAQTRPLPRAFAELTSRELQVLQQLAAGATNQEIAQRFYLSGSTVKVHVSHIFAKLGVRNRQQAASLARQHGLVAAL